MQLGRLACVGALLLWAAPASAATYYVSNSTGLDSRSCATAQTITTPKLTISAGIACLFAGDTLYIRGGTYTSALDRLDSTAYTVRSGTDWTTGAITIAAYIGETVTIRPPVWSAGISYTTVVAYHILQDLVIDMVNSGAIAGSENGPDGVYIGFGANHIRLERMEVKNNGANGIQMSDTNGNSPFNQVLDSLIHTNGQSLNPVHGVGGVHNGYGMYISTSDNLFDGNQIYDNGGYGAHFYDNDGAINIHRNLIINNKWYENGTHGPPGDNCGFLILGNDHIVYNNDVYANHGDGICGYSELTRATFSHNTVSANDGYGVTMQYYGAGNAFVNNIITGNGLSGGSDGIKDYGGTGAGPYTTTGNVITSVTFTSSGTNDFTLPTNSPLKNTVTCPAAVTTDLRGITRPQGASCEPGAYEIPNTGSAPVITTLTLQDGQAGAIYLQSVCATGGTLPYTWSLASGTLPTGLTQGALTSPCSTIGGTLTTAGTYTFTVHVADSAAQVDNLFYTVVVTTMTTTCASTTSGPWTLIANTCVGAGSSDSNADAVTATTDTTGADIAFCTVTNDQHVAAVGVGDTKSNPWVLVDEKVSNFDARVALYRSRLTSTGPLHGFYTIAVDPFSAPAISCMSFRGSNASPLDQVATSMTTFGSVTILPLGTINTRQTWTLTVASMAAERSNALSVEGYTVYQIAHSWGHNYGVAMAWRISATTELTTPTWVWGSPGTAMPASTVGAAFLAADSYVPKRRMGRR